MNLNKKEEQEFKKYAGIESMEVLACNPTIKQLNKLFGREDSEEDEEISYVDEKDGHDRIKIAVYLRGLQTNRIHREMFFIVDKPRLSKAEEGKTQTTQYINCVCDATFVDVEENLPEWFKSFMVKKTGQNLGPKTYRVALEGEELFYKFVRGVLSKVDYYKNPTTSIDFDMKKFKRGDFSQLKELVAGGDYCAPVCLLSTIVTDVEDNTKQYQRCFTKATLQGNFANKLEMAVAGYYKDRLEEIAANPDDFPEIKGLPLTASDIYGWIDYPRDIRFKSEWDQKDWNYFVGEVESQFGAKGFYKLTPVFEYDKGMDITAGDKSLSSAGPDY